MALAVSIWLFNVSIVINAILGFYDIKFFQLFLIQFTLKTIFEAAFLLPINSFFKRIALVSLLPILSPLHSIYLVYIGLIGNTKKYMWKDRLVK